MHNSSSWRLPLTRRPSRLFDRKRPSLRPDLPAGRAPRAEAVQDAALAAPATPARRVLDSVEHGASLAAGRDGIASSRLESFGTFELKEVCAKTTRGEPAGVAHTTTLYSVDREPTMMQSCASVARLLGGGPILSLGIGSHGRGAGHRRLGWSWHCTTLERSMPNRVSVAVGYSPVCLRHCVGRRTMPCGTSPRVT